MTQIDIEAHEGYLVVTSPYHPQFPSGARRLGGRWDAATRTWRFDPRDEHRVRDLCSRIYGTDGSPAAAELVTLRVRLDRGSVLRAACGSIFLAGRCVARAYGRDSGARLGPGVVVIDGSSPRSGGSMKNWVTIWAGPATFEVRDVPRQIAETCVAERDGVEIVGAD